MRNKTTKGTTVKLLPLVPLFAGALFVRAGMPANAATATASPAVPVVIAAAPLGAARDLGPAPDSRVDFSVVLPYRHPADLPFLLSAQSTPGSKYYRRFLKASEFRGYFSPTPAAYAAAAASLRQGGFAVETFSNRTVLHAHGKASAAERYFQTVIHAVRQSDGHSAYANVARALVPAALAGTRIVGLNSITGVQTAVHGPHAATHPHATGGPLFGPDGGYGPLAISKTEDFPIEHGYRGINSNVANIIDGPVSDSDVATFLKAFGLHRRGPRTTTLNVDGGCGEFCFDGESATIDAEWILAVAPGASLFTYEIPELSNNAIVDGFNAVASDDAVNIVNFDVGACEVSLADLLLVLQPIVEQGVAQGISYESAAFGGANSCGVPPLNPPIAPADLDTVVAVGGSNTIVDQTGTQLAASAFNGSNGGVSVVIPVPPWQANIAGIDRSGRNVPDIVIPSVVDGTGPSLFIDGTWAGGFTFVNNSVFAGYLASVQEMYGFATPLGNVAPVFYSRFKQFGYGSGARAFFADVTLGCIGAVANRPVCAKTGYDVASGIGSIGDGYALAKSLAFGPILPPTP